MPPYWSMTAGVNVDFVEITMGLQMRRLKEEEVDAQSGIDIDHEYCFHVRIKPRKLQSEYNEEEEEDDLLMDEDLVGRSILDTASRGIGRINIQPMQELQVVAFEDRFNENRGVFTLVARSFIPAPDSRRHGILWCTA